MSVRLLFELVIVGSEHVFDGQGTVHFLRNNSTDEVSYSGACFWAASIFRKDCVVVFSIRFRSTFVVMWTDAVRRWIKCCFGWKLQCSSVRSLNDFPRNTQKWVGSPVFFSDAILQSQSRYLWKLKTIDSSQIYLFRHLKVESLFKSLKKPGLGPEDIVVVHILAVHIVP